MYTGGLLTIVTLHPVRVNVNVIAAKSNNVRFIYLFPKILCCYIVCVRLQEQRMVYHLFLLHAS